ncbi:protein FAM171A2-like [Paramormyrops kingsleyae]|uniref:Family with sequence similarity 171 member A2 n=1 Tax=Paramormyrops kingsleyae TaxID=1676925 RepID=A0A3B3RQ05_9TELE|nr:protein FAM171A2-like [Paramormyrops kingsleyae]
MGVGYRVRSQSTPAAQKTTWINGHLRGNGDVVRRMPPLRVCRLLLLFLLFDIAWIALAKSIPDRGTLEVLLRVQVFDNSDLSPLTDATVEIYGNQSILASSKAVSDGIVVVRFQYHPGTWVIVAASKTGYVTNSAPWHANRIPLYASVSLYLLPQRPATLILYDDVVQVLSGTPGGRNQPWIQLQSKAVHLPPGTSYTDVWAVLTAARSQYEIGGFPYMLGRETNHTGGNSSWLELTAVAAVSAHLYARNGSAVQVSEPIHVSIPLPSDSPVKVDTSIPVWQFEAATGLWVRNGTGYIKREGLQLIWSFVASHLGLWVAAIPSATGMGFSSTGLRDMTTYHTIFLLAILGSMALLVLILLCLLLYYCRRRCLKPRQQRRKKHVSATLDNSKRDQGTSMSRLNLICGGHIETASSKGDRDDLKSEFTSSQDFQSSREEFFQHVPAHKLHHSKINKDGGPRRGESFQMVTRSTEASNLDHPLLHSDYTRSCSSMEDKGIDGLRRHNANDNKGYSSDPPSPPPFLSHKPEGKPPEYSASQVADHLARPTSLNTQPSQFIFCGSIDQMKENMYRSMVPTLVIPAHYMRLSSEFSGMDQGAESQQQQKQDLDDVPGCHQLTPQQQQQQISPPGEDPEGRNWGPNPSSGPVRIPVLFNDSTMAQMNGELQALTEKKLRELGVKQHPRAWFISLDGRSNSHVRHSYIDLGNETSVRLGHDANLDSGVDFRESKPMLHRKGKGEKASSSKGHSSKTYSKLAYADDREPSSSENRTAMGSPEDNSLTPLLDEGQEPRGTGIPRRGRSRVNSSRSSNSETRRDSMTSAEDENDPDDKDDEGENKKSPWQRREERPLMVFNVKK